MRQRIILQSKWWVSVSAADARLAASRETWTPDDLEMRDDSDNHPRQIDLPGGWQYGLRPRGEETNDSACESAVAKEEFVGVRQAAKAKRLPAHFLTYVRRVHVPEAWAGHTVFLHLDNARYNVAVHFNGIELARYVGGLEPHRIDVTGAVKAGGENELAITVGDVGVSGHRQFDPHNFTGNRLPTCREIENNLVHPVNYGGSDGRGIGEAWLEAVPRVRVEYVFANPKVSKRLLRYTVALVNDTDIPVTVRVHSLARPSPEQTFRQPLLGADGSYVDPAAVPSRTLLDEIAAIPARGMQKMTREVPWPDAVLWDTDQPFLYELVTTLEHGPAAQISHGQTSGKNGSAASRPDRIDTHSETFGFREFTINGHDFLLNGRKIHLHGQAGHVGANQHAMSLDQKIEFLRIAKEHGHVNHVRLHAKPQDRRWVEAADRVGMLITTETALWTTGFHSFDWAGSEEACYRNVRNHFMEALVRRDRNSPSVVIWSLSNEMSPITPWDLTEGPNAEKMAAMTRVFKRILSEAREEDDSRVIQMSSAMDFLGNLAMYNLHYPKSWQAYPDYPHTAYWMDKAFKFPWYGQGYSRMPRWSWRKDKPLYFGEYTCVFGPTPDVQSTIVGDIAFEEADFGTIRVQTKLWPMETRAYRRKDVSGFSAWAFLLGNETDCRKILLQPNANAYATSIRPIAVLDHNYLTDYLEGNEVAVPLSVHNDTRHDVALELTCEASHEHNRFWAERMPRRIMTPGASVSFVSRFLAPPVKKPSRVAFRVTLKSGETVADHWEREITVWPRRADIELPADFGIYDPDGAIGNKLAARGIRGGRLFGELTPSAISSVRSLWLGFGIAKANTADWRRLQDGLHSFVRNGGLLILDQPPRSVLGDLPVPLRSAKGYAEPDNRLEITCAFPCAPFHPVMAAFSDADVAFWAEDYYIAHECVEIPEEGNVMPLLVAGVDRAGLTSSPLLEIRFGKGSYLVSTLETLAKMDKSPVVARLFGALAQYRPQWEMRKTGVSVTPCTWQRLLEVGYGGENQKPQDAIGADIALLDAPQIEAIGVASINSALNSGSTVCLHAPTQEQTVAILTALNLPGTVFSGAAEPDEWDVFRHTHPLIDGMTNNCLYWMVGKSKLAPWTIARTHPEPASALIRLGETGADVASLTRRGALTVYKVGPGTLVFDHIRWHLTDLDEPERARRYVRGLMTNIGMPLLKGVEKRFGMDFETEAERRERGHF